MDLAQALFESVVYKQLQSTVQPGRVHLESPASHVEVCLDQKPVWWDVATGNNDVVTGTGHINEVTDMVIDGDNLISVGIDDTVRFTSVAARQFRSVT